MTTRQAERGGTTPVWSLSLRLLHWLLAVSMIASFVTHEGGGAVHEWTGYLALGAATGRIVMGIVATGYWRFSQFVRGLSATWAYAKLVWRQRENLVGAMLHGCKRSRPTDPAR